MDALTRLSAFLLALFWAIVSIFTPFFPQESPRRKRRSRSSSARPLARRKPRIEDMPRPPEPPHSSRPPTPLSSESASFVSATALSIEHEEAIVSSSTTTSFSPSHDDHVTPATPLSIMSQELAGSKQSRTHRRFQDFKNTFSFSRRHQRTSSDTSRPSSPAPTPAPVNSVPRLNPPTLPGRIGATFGIRRAMTVSEGRPPTPPQRSRSHSRTRAPVVTFLEQTPTSTPISVASPVTPLTPESITSTSGRKPRPSSLQCATIAEPPKPRSLPLQRPSNLRAAPKPRLASDPVRRPAPILLNHRDRPPLLPLLEKQLPTPSPSASPGSTEEPLPPAPTPVVVPLVASPQPLKDDPQRGRKSIWARARERRGASADKAAPPSVEPVLPAPAPSTPDYTRRPSWRERRARSAARPAPRDRHAVCEEIAWSAWGEGG